MDNLTHTLIGLVAAETVARATTADPAGLPAQSRRTTLLALGMVGGNLPDIDLLWSMSTSSGDKLGYLLEHRGYTHTLLGCAALAALLYAACLAWLRIRGRRPVAADYRLLGAFTAVAVLLHLGMDAFNSYGVHPFWPWDNRWYYGDAVFIVEPLYWIAAAPLFFVLRTKAARLSLGLVLAIASAAILFVHGFVVLWWAIPVAALLLSILGRRLRPLHSCLTSALLMGVVTLTFTGASAMASHRLAEVARGFPGFQTLDAVLSPSPAQPFCWDVLLLQRRDDEYVARRGQMNLIATSACPSVLERAGTAPMTPVSPSVGVPEALAGLRWSGQFAMSRARLATLANENCAGRELMQFVRAPFAAETSQGWVLGDLRFDREQGAGMAEIPVARQGGAVDCRHHVPWIAPRADLLDR